MSEINLKNYVCSIPFTSLRMEVRERFLCCPTWLEKYLPDEVTPYDAWNSQEAIDIRDSILDGSFKYCNSIQCPHLHQLKTFGENKTPYPLYNRENIPIYLKEKIKKHEDKEIFSPSKTHMVMRLKHCILREVGIHLYQSLSETFYEILIFRNGKK